MKMTLSEIMNGPWKERAIYTCEDRGIPQFADGLKPVHRFIICQAYKTAKTKFDKVAAISGSIAALGYEHGEQSAAGAFVNLAAYYCNNLPLFEGDGNFGSRLHTEAAAARYIFARLSPFIDYIFKDTELAPKNPDPEVVPPLYYLPIIPIFLLNGIHGIATGYAVDIPPHDPISIIDNLIRLCDGKDIKEIKPKYYDFSGSVVKNQDHYELTGTYQILSPIHFVVTDLPPGNTMLSYENYLKKLVDKGVIQSYENNSCNDNFNYDIYIKKGTRWTEEQLIKNLKLFTTHTWNLTTIMPDGKLHIWDKVTGIQDMILEFYKFRIPFIQQRINNKIIEFESLVKYYCGFIKFIQDIIDNKYLLKGIPEDILRSNLKSKYNIPDEYLEKVMNAPMRVLTTTKISEMEDKLAEANKKYDYYKKTTKEIEYKKDLEELKKVLNKGI